VKEESKKEESKKEESKKAAPKKAPAKAYNEKDIIEAPPDVKSRRFNECDIIGDFERDEKGNVITNEPNDNDGKFLDNKGHETNQRGYLIDPKSGDIINNFNG
jgi:hypothetical protein